MKAHWINQGADIHGFEWLGGETVRPDSGGLVEAIIGDPNFQIYLVAGVGS